jgi:hypothetical protein
MEIAFELGTIYSSLPDKRAEVERRVRYHIRRNALGIRSLGPVVGYVR